MWIHVHRGHPTQITRFTSMYTCTQMDRTQLHTYITCIHKYADMCIHAYTTHMYMQPVHIHLCVHIDTYTHTIDTHIHTHTHTHAHIHTHTHAHIHTHTHTYIHTHTHTCKHAAHTDTGMHVCI